LYLIIILVYEIKKNSNKSKPQKLVNFVNLFKFFLILKTKMITRENYGVNWPFTKKKIKTLILKKKCVLLKE